ncbi:AAA family ATPase [Streptomyces sp. NPDC055085]
MQPPELTPETITAIHNLDQQNTIYTQAAAEKTRHLARQKGIADAEQEQNTQREIVAKRGNQIIITRQKWLWRDRFPIGGLSLVAGKGDVSKSTLFACFAAWITTGQMKGEYHGQPRDIAYIVNEDSINVTVAPRMIAHGADLTRIHFPETRDPILGIQSIKLPRDIEPLRKYITDHQLVAVFVDPLSANVSGRKNDQGDMRDTYQAVNTLAEETGCAIIGLAHTRKAGAADVLEAVIGSSEQTNVARSVHGLVMDPEEDGARVLSCEKLNVGQKNALTSLRFKVNSVLIPCTDGTGDYTSQPCIEWLEEISDSASDIMSDHMLGHDGVDECARWLLAYLSEQGGEASSADVKEAAKSKRWSYAMLNRARKLSKVHSGRTRETPSRTIWTHPSNTESDENG